MMYNFDAAPNPFTEPSKSRWENVDETNIDRQESEYWDKRQPWIHMPDGNVWLGAKGMMHGDMARIWKDENGNERFDYALQPLGHMVEGEIYGMNNPGRQLVGDATSAIENGDFRFVSHDDVRNSLKQFYEEQAKGYRKNLGKIAGIEDDIMDLLGGHEPDVKPRPSGYSMPPYDPMSEINRYTNPDTMLAQAQMVPTHALAGMREYYRRPGEEHGEVPGEYTQGRYEALKNHISEHGITSPIFVDYDHRRGMGHISEGNHRLAIAEDLGMTHVPVVVNASGRRSKGLEAPMRYNGPMNFNGDTPSYMKPEHFAELRAEPTIKVGKLSVIGDKWVYLNGKVGFGNQLHDIAFQLGNDQGLPDAMKIANHVAAGIYPATNHDLAFGGWWGNHPQIYISNVHRSTVQQAVKEAAEGNRLTTE